MSNAPSHVWLTGASSGIGRALALGMAKRGAAVWGVGRDPARLHPLADEVRSAGGQFHPVVLDLMDDGALQAQEFPSRLELLIHCAGVVSLEPVATAQLQSIDANLQLHYRAPLQLTQRALPSLRKNRGQVVFVNSGAGLRTSPNWAPYAAAKHAMKSLTEGLREEEPRIRVIGVYPGRTATPMQARVRGLEGKSYDPKDYMTPEAVAVAILDAVVSPRSLHRIDLNLRP